MVGADSLSSSYRMGESCNEGSIIKKVGSINSQLILSLNDINNSMHLKYKKGEISVPEMLLTEPCLEDLNSINGLKPPSLPRSTLSKKDKLSISTSSLFKIEKNLDLKTSKVGKILIVDDERFNCDIIAGFLMILDVEYREQLTEFAYNGEQALNRIKKCFDEGKPEEFSLILMDCNMPFMDGYEATKQIRRLYEEAGITKNNQPRIVAVTGHVENEYVQKAISCGMDKVFSKPLPI